MSEQALLQYDSWHADRGVSEPNAPWHEMALSQVDDVQGLVVLEAACGRGGFARQLAERGAQLTAVDFSPTAVEIAGSGLTAFPKATAVVADVQRLPFADESFDLVVSLETLEHLPDPDAGLRELVRVTRRGGRLIITTPNYISLVGLYRLALRLAGRRFTEVGQPINQPLTLIGRVWKLHRLGCRVTRVEGRVQSLPIPRYRTVELRFLEHPRPLMKWFCRHGMTVATRRH